ncbi:flavin reductase family protein [Pseudoxanthomonas winnipegensis]|uniref:flavin reductase family protein n=1 Tax=Pseudoxanthomonas winnipegensis TaxID=2480810 RepID=UPI003F863A79
MLQTHDPRALRDAFGAFMTGVTVVTALDAQGRPIGFTANSFASVSLDPPLLLVCLARSSRNLAAFTQGPGFAVNVLAEHQKDISNRFAQPVQDRFAGLDWRAGPHGAPLIETVAAWFDCALERVVEAGDHVILLGRVQAFEHSAANGLGYVRGSYFTPRLAEEATRTASAAPEARAVAIATREDQVLLFEDSDSQLRLPAFDIPQGEDATLASRLREATELPVVVGFVYAVCGHGRERRIVYRCELGTGVATHGVFFAPEAIPLERIGDEEMRGILQQYVGESALLPQLPTRQAD